MNKWSRVWWALTAVVAIVGIITNVIAAAESNTPAYIAGHFFTPLTRALNQFTYFSLQSNIMIAVAGVMLAVKPNRMSSKFQVFWLTSLVAIFVTGVVYHGLLSDRYTLSTLGLIANQILHTAVPILAVLGWLVFGPPVALRRTTVWLSLVYPLAFLAFVLIRGAVINWYPYPFVDVALKGYGTVTINAVVLAILMLGLGAGAFMVDRRIKRRWLPATA